MSNLISFDYPLTPDTFDAQNPENSSFNLIKIKNIESSKQIVQLLSQEWFKTRISNCQNLYGINFSINEKLDKKYKGGLNILDLINKSSILVAIQSTSGKHESRIFWKVAGFEKNYSTFIDNDEDEELTAFVIEFIVRQMRNEKTGIQNSFEDKNQIRIHEIGDHEDSNLLILSAFWSRSCIVPKLLEYPIDVDYEDEFGRNAVDYAWDNYNGVDVDQDVKEESDKIIMSLLNANSRLSTTFDYSNASENVKNFINMCESLHQDVQNDNFKEVSSKIAQHPHLVHFYDRNNKSLLAFALELRKIEIVNILDQGISSGFHEDLDKVYQNLLASEKKSFQLQHRQNALKSPNSHLLILRLMSRIGNNDQFANTRWNHIEKAYERINSNEYCSKILKMAAKCKKLKIYFDFKHDSTYYLDPATSIYSQGIIYSGGSIIIGAKFLPDHTMKSQVTGVIAHELCHLATLMTFLNPNFDPFPIGESKQKTRFVEDVMEECEENKDKEPIVNNVFGSYEADLQHSEMIVTYPQALMHYYGDEGKVNEFEKNFYELVRYSKRIVEPELDRALVIYEILEDESKTVKYEDLTTPMKAYIQHSKINFQGIKTTFYEIIGTDENLIKELTSSQIRQMLTTSKNLQIGTQSKLDLGYEAIERSFKDQKSKFKTFDEVKSEANKLKIFILADHAGTGKTTAFADIAQKLKKKNKNFWVGFVNLRKCSDIFEKYLPNIEGLSTEDVEQMVMELNQPKSEIEMQVFVKLYKEGKIILLLDGFDEIAPKYTAILIATFKMLNNIDIAKAWYGKCELWISTRPNCAKILEELFKTPAHSFVDYTKEEIKKYIDRILKSCNVLDKDEKLAKLVQIMRFLSSIDQSNLNPLMIKIITELSANNKIKLDQNSFYDIYAAMINKQKEFVGPKIPILEHDHDSSLNVWDVHRALAIILIIGDNYEEELGFKIEELPIVRKWMVGREKWTSDMIQRYGFVTVDLNKPKDDASSIDFTHRSYAEFFVAQALIKYIFDPSDDLNQAEKEKMNKFLLIVHKMTVVNNFVYSFGKTNQKVIQQDVKEFLNQEIEKFHASVNSCLASEVIKAIDKLAVILTLDHQTTIKLWKLNDVPNLLEILVDKPDSAYVRIYEVTHLTEKSFGSNWHEKFNKSGQKLINDEEMEIFLDDKLGDRHWKEDQHLLKTVDLVHKNTRFANILSIPKQTDGFLLKILPFLKNVYPFGYSSKIQIEIIKRLQDIYTIHDFTKQCLVQADYNFMSDDAFKFIFECIKVKACNNIGLMHNLLYKNNVGIGCPLIKAFISNNPEKLDFSLNFYQEHFRSLREVFDYTIDRTDFDILYPLKSELYKDYIKLLQATYGTDTSKFTKSIEKYLEKKKSENLLTTVVDTISGSTKLPSFNSENFKDFLTFVYPNDKNKVNVLMQAYSDPGSMCCVM